MKSPRSFACLLAVLASLALTGLPAQAATQRYYFTGYFTLLYAPPAGFDFPVATGDRLSGLFDYDPEAGLEESGADRAIYWADHGLRITVADFAVYSTHLVYLLSPGKLSLFTGEGLSSTGGDWRFEDLFIDLVDNEMVAFHDPFKLPDFLPLNELDDFRFYGTAYHWSNYFFTAFPVDGVIDSVWTDAVHPAPEPATLLLLGSGFVAFSFLGRQRGRHRAN